MKTYAIRGPHVNWKASPAVLLSSRMKMFGAIVSEKQADEHFEKMIDDDNLKPIAFLEKGLLVSRSVAHITLSDGGMATGFLIAPDVLLTNWHVFGTKDDARGAVIRFNFQTDLKRNLLTPDEYGCDPDSLFKSSKEFDYAVVRVKASPATKWGCLNLEPVTIEVDKKVNIVQHPSGRPKEIAMNDNEVKYVDDTVLQYITDTLPGSSGSPVFNDDWQVVGLHHSGGNIPEPSTNSIHFRNEGIRIGVIISDLPSF
jgi:hypothetical protein